MKKLALLLFLPFFIACSSSSTSDKPKTEIGGGEKQVVANDQKLILFENEDGMFGYKNEADEVVLPPNYQFAFDFMGQVASVLTKEGWRIINKAGEELFTPFIFDNAPDEFSHGLARFVEHEKIGFYNEQGEMIIPAKYDFALPFDMTYAPACIGCKKEMMGEHYTMVGGKWGVINSDGATVIPFEYEKTKMEEGVLKVMENGEWRNYMDEE